MTVSRQERPADLEGALSRHVARLAATAQPGRVQLQFIASGVSEA
jgi:hypothetical protein